MKTHALACAFGMHACGYECECECATVGFTCVSRQAMFLFAYI
jgi:hypothetical protein